MITTLVFDFSYTLYFPNLGKGILNQELIEFVTQHQTEYDNYVFSATNKARLNKMKPQLVPPFIDLLSSKDIGSKDKPESYRILADEIGSQPEEMLFVDDSDYRVEAARAAGVTTVLFESNQVSLPKIKKALELM